MFFRRKNVDADLFSFNALKLLNAFFNRILTRALLSDCKVGQRVCEVKQSTIFARIGLYTFVETLGVSTIPEIYRERLDGQRFV